MAEDTWNSRALPLLETIAAIELEESLVMYPDLAERSGITVEEVDVELARLIDAGYAGGDIARVSGGFENFHLSNPLLLERGSRAVGQWPSDDPYDALLELLDRRIVDDSTDPETRTRLQNFRGAVVDVGKGVAGGVLLSLIRSGLGLP